MVRGKVDLLCAIHGAEQQDTIEPYRPEVLQELQNIQERGE